MSLPLWNLADILEAVAAHLAQAPQPPEAQAAHPGRFAGETAPGLVAAPSTEEAPR